MTSEERWVEKPKKKPRNEKKGCLPGWLNLLGVALYLDVLTWVVSRRHARVTNWLLDRWWMHGGR